MVEALDLDSAAHAASLPPGPFPHIGGKLSHMSHMFTCANTRIQLLHPFINQRTAFPCLPDYFCQFLCIHPNKAQQVVRVQYLGSPWGSGPCSCGAL